MNIIDKITLITEECLNNIIQAPEQLWKASMDIKGLQQETRELELDSLDPDEGFLCQLEYIISELYMLKSTILSCEANLQDIASICEATISYDDKRDRYTVEFAHGENLDG